MICLIRSQFVLSVILSFSFTFTSLAGKTEQDKSGVFISTVDGLPVVNIPLDTGQGGMLLPIPEAILNTKEGTIALRLNVANFPSNGTILDFGGGGSGRVIISESSNDELSQHGHFRLVVSDDSEKQIAEAPVGPVGKDYTLAITWRNGEWTFWVDGKGIGSVHGVNPLNVIPDRLALVEPIGVQWKQLGVWSQALAVDQLLEIVEKDHWSLDSEMTFLARRGGNDSEQSCLIGSGLLAPPKVVEILEKQISRRELFVNVATGSDGNDGSSKSPFKTISKAAGVAGPGDRVTVMPGTYRESIVLARSGKKDAPILFQASPEGPVTLEGTDPLDGFQSERSVPGASLWVKTGYHSRDVPFGTDAYRQKLMAQGPNGLRQIERRGRIDTLWCDGRVLPKAESSGVLRPNAFWVDKDRNELILALGPDDNPRNHLLEVGARGAFFSGNVSYIVLRGFRAMRADTANFRGAIDLGISSSNWKIENIQESSGNWGGIFVRGWGHILQNNIVDSNGDEGISGSLCQYIVLDGNTCRFNNWERGINPGFEAAGSKFTQVDHMTVRNHEAAFNRGPGMWWDANNRCVTVENSVFHNNLGGIDIEISKGPFLLRNNICFSNDEGGIGIGESSNVIIKNNTLVGNKYGIDLRNLPNRKGPGLIGLNSTWKVENIDIKRNIIALNTVAGIRNSFASIDVGQAKITSDYNLFYKNWTMIMWPMKIGAVVDATLDASNDWAPPESGGGTRLLSFNAIHKVLGIEEHGIDADPGFRMPGLNEYETGTSGPASMLDAGYEFDSDVSPVVTSESH